MTAILLIIIPGSSPPDRPPLGAIVSITRADQLVFPLDDYGMSNAALGRGALAGEYLIRDCMKRFGLTWTVRPMPAPPPTMNANTWRYGLLDAATAATYGYHAPPDPSAIGRSPLSAPFSAEVDAALTGSGASVVNGVEVPPGGCSGEASRRLDEGTPQVKGPPPVLFAYEAAALARRDRRVLAVWAGWSVCMASAGYDYQDPSAAQQDPRWGGPTPSEREIATAKADVACRQQVNLVGIWYAVEVAYQNFLIEQHAHKLAQWKLYREVYQRNVEAVLANVSP